MCHNQSDMTMTPAMADAGLEVMYRVCRTAYAVPFMDLRNEKNPRVLDLNDITIKLVNNEYRYVSEWCDDMKGLETFAINRGGPGSPLAASAALVLQKFERERGLIYSNDRRNWLSEVCAKMARDREAQMAASAAEPQTETETETQNATETQTAETAAEAQSEQAAEAETETSEEFSPDLSWWSDHQEDPEPFESWTPMEACDLLMSDDLAFDFDVSNVLPAPQPLPDPVPLAPPVPLPPPVPPTPKETVVTAPRRTGGKAPRQVSDKGQKGPPLHAWPVAQEPRIRLHLKVSPISPASGGCSPFPAPGHLAHGLRRSRRARRRNRRRDSSSDEYLLECD